MRGFAVYTAGKGSILLSGHLNVKKRNAAISFLFHCELDVAVKPVEVFQEEAELLLSVLPDDKGIIDVPQPQGGTVACCVDGELLEFFHEQICQNRG